MLRKLFVIAAFAIGTVGFMASCDECVDCNDLEVCQNDASDEEWEAVKESCK